MNTDQLALSCWIEMHGGSGPEDPVELDEVKCIKAAIEKALAQLARDNDQQSADTRRLDWVFKHCYIKHEGYVINPNRKHIDAAMRKDK